MSLENCDRFFFTVSFIKKAGLVLMQKAIEAALKRGAQGRIITSTYQNFTDVSSLEVFLSWQEQYKNFECRLEWGTFGEAGFHTKGYLFDFDNRSEVIIGSSNITRFALLLNKEWDISVSVHSDDVFLASVRKEFDDYWQKTYPLNRDIVRRYQARLQYAIEMWDMDFLDPEEMRGIRPNAMQRKALKEINRYRSLGANRCLVVAATGSGKTYLAAFDALNFNPKKLLFIVHRDTILHDAMETFHTVFRNSRTYGIYTGEAKQLDADFLFASNQIMSRNLALFDPREFDYIVIDEVHHATAATYQKIIQHFDPQFLLGLTATPERMDGGDIYEMFGDNVPYDLRLREAIENDLVVPFHYYGIKDSLVSYEDDITSEGIRRYISQLASQTHCEFVDQQIKAHLPSGKLKCIGFCRTVEHARLMAEGMRDFGYTTCYLSGADSWGARQKAFSELSDDNHPLQIIFAVDVLNEGIDIPSMNMALFLRPTDSSTIFLQQLGRGLRKYEDKEFLTVLDFIGNSYKRSVQIAMALGSLSKAGSIDKTTAMDYVRTEFKTLDIPGLEIHIDRESRDEILTSIEKTNFNTERALKQDYLLFKQYLLKNGGLSPYPYPMPTDYLSQFVNDNFIRFTKKSKSYIDFLRKVEDEAPYFDEKQTNVLRTLSWFLPLVRKAEFLIVKALLKGPLEENELQEACEIKNPDSFAYALDVLQGKASGSFSDSFIPLVKKEEQRYSLTFDPGAGIFLAWVEDLLAYGLERHSIDFGEDESILHLYGAYSGPQSFLAMNVRESTENRPNIMQMTGVCYLKHGLCLYITLHKNESLEERLKYSDKFIGNRVLSWESQTGTTLVNTKGKRLIEQKRVHVFVQKCKTEDGIAMPFIYLGEGELTNPRDSGKAGLTLLFDIVLDQPVPDVYRYDFGLDDK